MLFFVLFVSYFEERSLKKSKVLKKKKRKKVLKNMMSKKYMHTSTADSARIVKEIDVVSMYIRTKKRKKRELLLLKTHLSKSISIDAISLYKKYTVP